MFISTYVIYVPVSFIVTFLAAGLRTDALVLIGMGERADKTQKEWQCW